MAKIAALYPRDLGTQEQIEQAGRVFREFLGNLEGPPLERAYREVLRKWTKASPPKPADFLAEMEGETGRTSAKGFDRRGQATFLAGRVPELVRIALLPYVGDAALFDLEHIAQKLAHRYAQAEWLWEQECFASEHYKLTPEEERIARERRISRNTWKGSGTLGAAAAKLVANAG
jgi:hypothetical protein